MNKLLSFSPLACVILILSLPILVAGAPLVLSVGQGNTLVIILCLLLTPSLYVVSYVATAGVLASFCRAAIVKGRVLRRPDHPLYRQRRVYGTCWTMVYYFTPLYHICLQAPFLKALLFRLFGYRGPLAFTCYPDTWIRDLALLKLGEHCYLSNRATIGTNLVQMSGHLLVDSITIGDYSVIGHLAVLAPGVVVGHHCEIGVKCTIGIRVRIGNHVTIKPTVTVYHGTVIGDHVTIEPHVYVGLGCVIAAGLKIPNGCYVPDKTQLACQADVEQLCLEGGPRLWEKARHGLAPANVLGS